MNTDTEHLLSTGWKLVRDAGVAVGDAATHSRVGTGLVKSYPRVKELVTTGAGLAIARKGTRVAVSAVRRNPVLAIAGAVALAGLGLALAVHKRKKAAQADGDGATRRPRRVAATNMRGRKPAAEKAARTPRTHTVAKPRDAST